MASVNEAAGDRTEFAAGLKLGLDTLSKRQEITFTKYVKMILPLDGFVFWVKADILSPIGINAAAINTQEINATPKVQNPANTIKAMGSLHYATENNQDETEGFATNRVIFTSEVDVEELNTIAPRVLYVGEFEGLKFAFSMRSSFYRQADLFHYQGFAVYPALATQLIDTPVEAMNRDLVVSNSLPIWLTLNQQCPMYPSFLIDDNINPPWCAVHIEPGMTSGLQSAPFIDSNGSHWQLATDHVRLTFYGLRNDAIFDWLDYVLQFSLYSEVMGVMNIPVPRDDKRTQAELGVLAIRKTIEFDVNYYQARVRDAALTYIKSVFLDLIVSF